MRPRTFKVRDVERLRALALRQHGVFTTADALACGWTPHWVAAARRAGDWTALYQGVWVETDWFRRLDKEARHLCALRARLLAQDGEWWASRRSAALVHGLPLLGEPPASPQIVGPLHETRARGRNRAEQRAPLPLSHRAEVEGVSVTSMPRTVVDVARTSSFTEALMCCERALQLGMSAEEVAAVARLLSRWPGGRQALEVVAFADPRSESALESVSRAAFRRLGLPMPECQVEIWHDGRFLGRSDFFWREANLVGEADGALKYARSGPAGTGQDPVLVLLAEKEREGGFRDVGLEVVRWGWHDALHATPEFEARIRHGLERGTRHVLLPGVSFRQAGLSAVRRSA